MGCSCGYNVYIKNSYHSLLPFLEIPLPYVTKPVRSNFATVVLLPLSLLPPSCSLYTCTSQPSSYQNGMSSFTTSVKTKPFCSTVPWRHKFSYCTPCTKTIHPHLCNQRNKNNSLATQTQKPSFCIRVVSASTRSKHHTPAAKFWKNFFMYSTIFFVL